jgi:four helix bundle suffix protein
VSHREATADAALAMLAVACSLLDRQIAAQARAFEAEGGVSEGLYRVRSKKRRSIPSPSFPKSTPSTSD